MGGWEVGRLETQGKVQNRTKNLGWKAHTLHLGLQLFGGELKVKVLAIWAFILYLSLVP